MPPAEGARPFGAGGKTTKIERTARKKRFAPKGESDEHPPFHVFRLVDGPCSLPHLGNGPCCPGYLYPHGAHLRIKPDQVEAFTAAVKEEMEAALRLEPGVVAIYTVAEKGDPTKWTFFKMYVDEEAYQIHRDTPHFQKYFHTTKGMIADRVLLEAVPVELRDKHNTPAAD